jgi:hypothetical protein
MAGVSERFELTEKERSTLGRIASALADVQDIMTTMAMKSHT